MKLSGFIFLIFISISSFSFPQNNKLQKQNVFVDSLGIMRWENSKEEVKLFGVNYTTPFAYSYRAQKKMGLNLKQAIDLDVAQMVRLGFDAFRVHVWDKEISDSAGNMVANEHLDLLDYLLWKLESSGIKTILTPIAWWGNGWPEPDGVTNGFAQPYSKLQLITDENARAAQRNYLKQFVNHRNPYSKYTFGNDPSIIAMEIINEPFHPDDGKMVTDYINEMVDVIRGADYTKPIFYNISQNWNDIQAQAVCNAKIQGVSFQWYPTDLVHNNMLKGNFLFNVDHYKIPAENISGYDNKAKMVYEFESADIGGSYMYPAMARSFKEAGMQFATMFSYEPSQIAWSNTEYPTHFLNLLYTPSKAISLMIAGDAFHKLPLKKSYGEYPANNQFENFRVSYDENLSVANSDSCFYYSNSTTDIPRNVTSLKHIAGCGNSDLVKYNGTGAYFLDKVEDGIWKLEVYPDALWLSDPFEPTSMQRQVARLYWNEREISITLPELDKGFLINKINGKKLQVDEVTNASFKIRPGIYLLSSSKLENKIVYKYLKGSEGFLAGLYTPPSKTNEVYVVNHSVAKQLEGKPIQLKFQIAAEKEIIGAELSVKRFGWRNFAKYTLRKGEGFIYSFEDSSKIFSEGEVQYCLSVKTGNKIVTFPGGITGSPNEWDFRIDNPWKIVISKPGANINLFSAVCDRKDLLFPHYSKTMQYDVNYKSGRDGNATSLAVKVRYSDGNELPFGVQLAVDEKVNSIVSEQNDYRSIVVRGQSNQNTTSSVKLNLLMNDGSSYTSVVELQTQWEEIVIPLEKFVNGNSLVLPNSYPLFFPRVRESLSDAKELNPFDISAIQIVCEDKMNEKKETGFEIESIYLTTK